MMYFCYLIALEVDNIGLFLREHFFLQQNHERLGNPMNKFLFLMIGCVGSPTNSACAMEPPSLHNAAAQGDLSQLAELLHKGANVNEPDQQGNTPLHLAAQNGHGILVQFLVGHKADVNRKNMFHYIPLHLAAASGHTAIVQALIVAGSLVNLPGPAVMAPLHLAALGGHLPTIEALIKGGARVDLRNAYGQTPLDAAAETPNCIAIARALIDAGLNVNAQDLLGNTPLHGASYMGNIELVKLLIAAGADLDLQSWSDHTPIQEALANKKQVIVTLLNDYAQRIKSAELRGRVNARIIALATHPRLGTATPFALLPKKLMQHILRLTLQAEAYDARQPNPDQGQNPWYMVATNFIARLFCAKQKS